MKEIENITKIAKTVITTTVFVGNKVEKVSNNIIKTFFIFTMGTLFGAILLAFVLYYLLFAE